MLDGKEVKNIDTRRLGNYIVKDVAMDKYGNVSKEVIRRYEVIDVEAPEVRYEEKVVVKKGHTYSYADMIIEDNCEGIVRVEVIEDGVDYEKAGTYRIGYKVVDESGNATIVYRTVIVENDTSYIWYLVGLISAIIMSLGLLLIRRKKLCC